MLIDEFISIKPIYNLNHYKSLGYIITNTKDLLQIKTSDLPRGSNVLINCKCDICGNEKELKYSYYYRSFSNGDMYACSSKCSQIKIKMNYMKKYGVSHFFETDDFKNKSKDTHIEKYGVEHCMQNKDIQNKMKITNIEKYGVEYYLQSDDKKEKSKITNLEKYGVEYLLQNKEIRDKAKIVLLEKYGVEYALQNKEIKDKVKSTNLEKYGVEYYLESELFKSNINKTRNICSINFYKNKLPNYLKILYYDDLTKDFNLFDNRTNEEFIINRQLLYDRIKLDIEISTIIHPKNSLMSFGEKSLSLWIEESNSNIIKSDRKTLEGKELDIYLPYHNLAIEYNGLRYHNEDFRPMDYHLNKSLKCRENNIDLIHIWEDEWLLKQNIVKSLINDRLGIYIKNIESCDCTIKNVNKIDAEEFILENSLNKISKSSIRYGLYYNDILVTLITFSKNNDVFTIQNYCNILDIKINGSEKKLLDYFKINNKFSKILYKTDFRLCENFYKKMGFVDVTKILKPNYFWVLGIKRIDEYLSISEMLEKSYRRIYDCGKLKLEIRNI